MVLIKHFIMKDFVEVVVYSGYIKNPVQFTDFFSKMRHSSFKFNKVRRTFRKTYYAKDYTDDTFNQDLKLIKSMFKDYKIETYKLVKEEKSY